MKAYTTFSTRQTAQTEKIPGKKMKRNNAGGYSFKLDKWKRLERFLVLGSEGGTYYVEERKLTKENAKSIIKLIKENGKGVVDITVDISLKGRAPKNDPALFVLAMCASLGSEEVRRYALNNLHNVARIPTHLFHFLEYVEQFRGWGRALRDAVANWYLNKKPDYLAYQVVKYQSRDGWSNRDALRLSHPKTENDKVNNIFKWIVSGEVSEPIEKIIEGFEKAKNSPPSPELIKEYGLTREMVPTEWLNSASVWEALLEGMPLTALLRNLGKMTQVGLLKPFSAASIDIVNKITNQEHLIKSRIHPLSVLTALKTYSQGRGIRGSLSWEPVRNVIGALDEAFYLSFGNVTPTNKRLLLAVDVSGSMSWGDISGMPLTPRDASAAMSLITARTESNYHIMGFAHEFRPLSISPRQRLDDVVKYMARVRMGGTDCALPMIWAIENKVEIDAFIVYTDSETWYGRIHPAQALNQYRNEFNIPTKLIVVGMTANKFSIADPNDAGMLDVVGFDTATPNLMANFILE